MNIIKKASAQLASSIPKRDKEPIKCFYCKGDINDDTDYYQENLANDTNYYHTQCLTCHQCKKNCSAEFYFTFKKINNYYLPTIYCRKDMNPTCFLCGTSIERGGLVTFLGNKYHESHFKCAVCQEILSMDSEVFEIKKKLYCLKHFVKEYKKEQEYQKKFISKKKYHQSNSNSMLLTGSKLSLAEENEEKFDKNILAVKSMSKGNNSSITTATTVGSIGSTTDRINHVDPENSTNNDINSLSHSGSVKSNSRLCHKNSSILQYEESLSTKHSNAVKKVAVIMNHTIGSPSIGQASSNMIMGSLGSTVGNTSFDDFYDEEEEEEEEEDFGDIEGLSKYRNENLDVRDFSNNDYSTKYCGGCKTMLLAGTNIKEIRFRDNSSTNNTSSKSVEFWHLDCFVMFVRYKVIFSPQFIDPRRYRIFNLDASSMNMNNDLRNISNTISLLFENMETCFSNIMKCVEQRDEGLLKSSASKRSNPRNLATDKSDSNDRDDSKNFIKEESNIQFYSSLGTAIFELLLKINILFKVLEDVLFLIDDDQYSIIQDYQIPKDTHLNDLEKINFNPKYNLMKNTHLRLYDSFKEFLSSDIQEYDIVFFNHHFLGILNYIVKFMLHKILIFNYLNKQNMTMNAFFHNLKQRLLDDEQIEELIIDANWKCEKCHDPIHLESYILKVDTAAIPSAKIRKYKVHTNCVEITDLKDTFLEISESYVAALEPINATRKEEASDESLDNTMDDNTLVDNALCVSIYDCLIDEIKFLVDTEISAKKQKQEQSPF